MIKHRFLQIICAKDKVYGIDTKAYEENSWSTMSLCECGSKVKMCSSDINFFKVTGDYKWRCDNMSCINNICPTNTYDDEQPNWVRR